MTASTITSETSEESPNMDRGRRAEPYSNATIWTREVARNLASHLARISKAHSCVDTKSPKSTQFGQFHHTPALKKSVGNLSPVKTDRDAILNDPMCDLPNNQDDIGLPLLAPVNPKDVSDEMVCSSQEINIAPALANSRRRAKAMKKIKLISRRTQLELDKQAGIAAENQRLVNRIAKISTAKDHKQVSPASHNGTDLSGYDGVTSMPKRNSQDYHKRQEQLKIHQENLAMSKRLKNTKPTLKHEDWEKDDKWNQNFLKAQERRRQALHQEMARAIGSPQSACIRVKPHRHSSLASPHESDIVEKNGENRCGENQVIPAGPAIKVITSHKGVARRRRSSDETRANTAFPRHSSAANHRRIMELRDKKSMSCEQGNILKASELYDTRRTDDSAHDDVIAVRFTFSSQSSRLHPLIMLDDTSKVFSPATDLEAVLDEINCEGDQLSSIQSQPSSSEQKKDAEQSSGEREIQDIVFAVLQECTDSVVVKHGEENDEVHAIPLDLPSTLCTVSPDECSLIDCIEAGMATTTPTYEAENDQELVNTHSITTLPLPECAENPKETSGIRNSFADHDSHHHEKEPLAIAINQDNQNGGDVTAIDNEADEGTIMPVDTTIADGHAPETCEDDDCDGSTGYGSEFDDDIATSPKNSPTKSGAAPSENEYENEYDDDEDETDNASIIVDGGEPTRHDVTISSTSTKSNGAGEVSLPVQEDDRSEEEDEDHNVVTAELSYSCDGDFES